MALYHFHVTQIKRSNGNSAVASAAYRAGQRLYSERYDEVNDYTHKGGVICSEILLPPQAPEKFKERQTLWNEVEAVEKRADAQLAYSFDLVLQNELSQEENIALARQFIEENLVAKGMIADYAVHDPDGEDGGIRNPHVHIMCPIRPLNEDGSWGSKQKKVPVLNAEGKPVWNEKQKRYRFNAVPTTDWGNPETLDRWRENWCLLCNQAFEKKGLEVRIDHRSYADQGLDLLAQIHEGPEVRAMEKKGIPTEIGAFNRWGKKTNAMIRELLQKLAALREWIRETEEELKQPVEAEPNIRILLLDYMDQKKADCASKSAAYRQKVQVSVLKDVSSAMCFLSDENVETFSELEMKIAELSEETDHLKESMNDHQRKMKKLKLAIDQIRAYEQFLPVAEELNKPKSHFKKKKESYRAEYKKEHESELKAFYRARRILKEAGMEGEFDPGFAKIWGKELKELEAEYNADLEKLKPIREEVRKLNHIRYCVNRVIKEKEAADVVYGRTDTKSK